MRSLWALVLIAGCGVRAAPEVTARDATTREGAVMADTSRVGDGTSDPEAPAAGPRNVLGGPLAPCSVDPMTGWYRDGSCRTDDMDRGSHVVCATVNARFLAFTKGRGNDLSTPRPEHRFPGLKPGDRWCLCARRWLEAHEAGAAPQVALEATHARALAIVPAEVLIPYGRPN
jgi:uncharacterized protein (DUF2237 family)